MALLLLLVLLLRLMLRCRLQFLYTLLHLLLLVVVVHILLLLLGHRLLCLRCVEPVNLLLFAAADCTHCTSCDCFCGIHLYGCNAAAAAQLCC
jgi:hypothetical protein